MMLVEDFWSNVRKYILYSNYYDDNLNKIINDLEKRQWNDYSNVHAFKGYCELELINKTQPTLFWTTLTSMTRNYLCGVPYVPEFLKEPSVGVTNALSETCDWDW